MSIPPGGRLYIVGDYGSNRRGINISNESIAPVFDDIKGVIHISCGWYHNLLYTKNHIWWGFGENHKGQLDSRHKSMSQPKQLTFWKGIKPLWFSCSDGFTAIIDQNEKLYVCGDSKTSELTEFGNIQEPVVYCDYGADTIVVLPKGTGIYFFPSKSNIPHYFCSDQYFVDCAASSRSFTALDSCGKCSLLHMVPNILTSSFS